jgi:hypothetical protein
LPILPKSPILTSLPKLPIAQIAYFNIGNTGRKFPGDRTPGAIPPTLSDISKKEQGKKILPKILFFPIDEDEY